MDTLMDFNKMIEYYEYLSTVSVEAKNDYVIFMKMNTYERLNFLMVSSRDDKVYKYTAFCPISQCYTPCEFAFSTYF